MRCQTSNGLQYRWLTSISDFGCRSIVFHIIPCFSLLKKSSKRKKRGIRSGFRRLDASLPGRKESTVATVTADPQIQWSTVVFTLLFYLLLVVVCQPHDAIKLGGDEHFELLKAELVASGSVSNRDFWNDQPPGLTYLLAGIFSVFGAAAFPARMLTVLLTAALLATVPLIWGGRRLKGFVFALLLLSAPGFPRYSMSAMADPVKIPLCVLSCGLALWAVRRRSTSLAVLSGLTIGGTVLIKYTAALYLPGVMWAGWLAMRDLPSGTRWRIASGFLAGGAVWLPWFCRLLLQYSDQLLFVHFSENRSMEPLFPEEHVFGWRHIAIGFPLWLGGAGALLLVAWRIIPVARAAFPAAVLAVHFGMAFYHRPWWDYYLLDLWLALSWLFAETFCWGYAQVARLRNRRTVRTGERTRVRWQLAALVLGMVWLSLGSALILFHSVQELWQSPRIRDSEVIAYFCGIILRRRKKRCSPTIRYWRFMAGGGCLRI